MKSNNYVKENQTEEVKSKDESLENFIDCIGLSEFPVDSKSKLLGEFQLEFNDLLKVLQEDVSEGKIRYKNKQKFIRTFNKSSKAYLGKGVFSITDVKFSSSQKINKDKRTKDKIVLTITGAKNNSAKELNFKFYSLYGFEVKDNNWAIDTNLEIDLELHQINDARELRLCFEYLWDENFLHLLKHDEDTKIFKQKINSKAKKLGRHPETLKKILRHCSDINSSLIESGLGKDDYAIVKLKDLAWLRSKIGIQKTIESGEHTKLYHALFSDGLISRKTFDQAIKDNIDLHSLISDFRYSENFENEGEAKKEEILGRIMLERRNLDEAWKHFEKAKLKCFHRYVSNYEELDWGETPSYGNSLYTKIAHEYKKLGKYHDVIKCHKVIVDLEEHNWGDAKYEAFSKFTEVLNENLLYEIDRRKNIERRMKRMVAQYSHTLGNTLFPETIHKVSEELKSHIDFKENSLILRKAYYAEILVKHQAEMLRAKHGSESGLEFRQYILNDRLAQNSGDDSVKVTDILDSAAERVVGRLLNQKSGKLRKVRKHIEDKNKMSIDKLRSDFEERVFFNEKLTAIEWLNEKLGKTSISKLSPSWSKLTVRNDGYTHALLQGHWGELLFNALKYGKQDSDNFLNVKFNEQEEEHTWLQIIWENPIAKKDDNTTGEGLEGIKEDLRQLNEEGSDYSLDIENKKKHFRVTLNYRSDLLILEESSTPELDENYFN